MGTMGTRARLRNLSGILLLAGLTLGQPVAAAAHGGFPLRLGVAPDPDLLALSQVIVIALRDGQGMSVERKLFPDRAALLAAWRAREIDLLVDRPAEAARAARALPASGCGEGVEALIAETYRAADGPAAVEFLGSSLAGSPCGRPGLLARRSVADNLRYSTLRDAVRQVASAVGRDDLDRLVRAAAGGERALVQAVREFLERKGIR